MFLTDVMTYLMKGTLTNIKGVLKGDGKLLSELGVDATPTANSKNLVESGGVESALDDKQNKITSSGVLTGDGSGGISGKTLDTSTLTDDNDHVPTSGVVKSAIDAVTVNIKVVTITEINAQTFSVSDFSTTYGTTKNIISVLDYTSASMLSGPRSYSYDYQSDILYIKSVSAPTSGTVVIRVSYI